MEREEREVRGKEAGKVGRKGRREREVREGGCYILMKRFVASSKRNQLTLQS